jgi:hypothetical protein
MAALKGTGLVAKDVWTTADGRVWVDGSGQPIRTGGGTAVSNTQPAPPAPEPIPTIDYNPPAPIFNWNTTGGGGGGGDYGSYEGAGASQTQASLAGGSEHYG